jgi:hypothetical protein
MMIVVCTSTCRKDALLVAEKADKMAGKMVEKKAALLVVEKAEMKAVLLVVEKVEMMAVRVLTMAALLDVEKVEMKAVLLVVEKVEEKVDLMAVKMADKSVVMLDLQDTNCLCMNKHLEYYSIDQSIERLIHLDIPDAYIHLKDNS